MRKIKGKIKYNKETDRMYVEDSYGIPSAEFHCGDIISIRIDEAWHKARIEYNGEWILILGDTKEIKIYGNKNIEGIEALSE